jgi:hypothetical protein
MSSHTERTHRLLLLWLDLQKAVSNTGLAQVLPWKCASQEVNRLWEQITDPKNQRALEEWLYQSVEGQPAEWARKALQACRDRNSEKPDTGKK